MNLLVVLAWFMEWNKNGSLLGISGFFRGGEVGLRAHISAASWEGLAQVGPLNMVLLRSTWSAATTLYNNSSFWSWPIASISTTWVSLKSDTLAWVFNHAVWGPGAASREKERKGDGDRETDVKKRAENKKDCSGRGNRGLNSDEIIQFVSWQNRQNSRNRSPPGNPCWFQNLLHSHTFDYKVNLCSWSCFKLKINTVICVLTCCRAYCWEVGAPEVNQSKQAASNLDPYWDNATTLKLTCKINWNYDCKESAFYLITTLLGFMLAASVCL